MRENPFLTVRQLSEIFDKSRYTIRELVRKHKLKTIVVDGKTMIRRNDLKNVLTEGRHYVRN